MGGRWWVISVVVGIATFLSPGASGAAGLLGTKCAASAYGTVQAPTPATTYTCALVAPGRYQWVQVNGPKLQSSLGSTPATVTAAVAAVKPTAGSKAAPATKTSKDSPGALGSINTLKDADNGNIDVLVQSFDPNAWPKIKAANEFNSPPPAGKRYTLVRLGVTYHAGKREKSLKGTSLALGLSVFGKSGVEAKAYECYANTNDDLDGMRELLDGGHLEGNVCFLLTECDATGPVLFRVEESFCFSNCDVAWVKLQ